MRKKVFEHLSVYVFLYLLAHLSPTKLVSSDLQVHRPDKGEAHLKRESPLKIPFTWAD